MKLSANMVNIIAKAAQWLGPKAIAWVRERSRVRRSRHECREYRRRLRLIAVAPAEQVPPKPQPTSRARPPATWNIVRQTAYGGPPAALIVPPYGKGIIVDGLIAADIDMLVRQAEDMGIAIPMASIYRQSMGTVITAVVPQPIRMGFWILDYAIRRGIVLQRLGG